MTKNLFGFEQIRVNDKVETKLIFEEINKELEEYLLEKSIATDLTGSVFDFLESLKNQVHEDFDELFGKNTNKKRFIKALTCVFALLLNTKVDTANKIKRIFKIVVETTLKMYRK